MKVSPKKTTDSSSPRSSASRRARQTMPPWITASLGLTGVAKTSRSFGRRSRTRSAARINVRGSNQFQMPLYQRTMKSSAAMPGLTPRNRGGPGLVVRAADLEPGVLELGLARHRQGDPKVLAQGGRQLPVANARPGHRPAQPLVAQDQDGAHAGQCTGPR